MNNALPFITNAFKQSAEPLASQRQTVAGISPVGTCDNNQLPFHLVSIPVLNSLSVFKLSSQKSSKKIFLPSIRTPLFSLSSPLSLSLHCRRLHCKVEAISFFFALYIILLDTAVFSNFYEYDPVERSWYERMSSYYSV